jgi:osmotically-inducible protein OsmY
MGEEPLCGCGQTPPARRCKLQLPVTPKRNAMKTDSQLQLDVLAELQWEPAVHAAQIGVEAKDGVVTLIGQVPSYAEKWAAERATQRVSGVKALAVSLEVHVEMPGQRSDTDIARSVQNVLEWLVVLPVDTVKAMVEKGWVTLTGHVEWQYQKHAAVDAVRPMLGVRGVTDDITITAAATSAVVKADIQAVLKRRALADASRIGVDVQDGDVTLTGEVHNWSERELVTHAAWGTKGVRNVVDRMHLVY